MSEPPSRNITKPYVSLLWYKSQVHRFLRDLQYVSMTLDPLHIFDCVAILITHLDQWCIVQHTTYDCNEVTPIQNTYPSVKNVIRTNDYIDFLANNPFLDPVPFGVPNDVLALQKSQITRPPQQSGKMETLRIEARERFELSVKRFEDSRKHADETVHGVTI